MKRCPSRRPPRRFRRACGQVPRPRRFRGHAPRRPPCGRDARFHRAARQAGHDDGRARQALPRFHRGARRHPRPARLQGFLQIDLHVGQPCRLPRHPGRQGAGRRRHPEHRRDAHARRLARRLKPHVSRGRRGREGAQADRHDVRGDDAGHRPDQAGRHIGRHRPRDPEACRGAALLGRARFLRPRPGPRVPRFALGAALRQARRKAWCCAPACSSRSSR